MATNRSIEQLALWLNPLINGWISYYSRSALYAMSRHVNKALIYLLIGEYG